MREREGVKRAHSTEMDIFSMCLYHWYAEKGRKPHKNFDECGHCMNMFVAAAASETNTICSILSAKFSCV